MKNQLLCFAVLAVSLAGCQQSEAPPPAAVSPAPSPAPSATPVESPLIPLPGKEGAVPALTEVTTVRLATTGGDVVIEVYPQAAPNAAKRFVELVTSGFYD